MRDATRAPPAECNANGRPPDVPHAGRRRTGVASCERRDFWRAPERRRARRADRDKGRHCHGPQPSSEQTLHVRIQSLAARDRCPSTRGEAQRKGHGLLGSARGLDSIAVANLRDVVQAARFPDEIELDARCVSCQLEELQEPRKRPRTDTPPHRLLGCPLLYVPNRGFIALFGPHPTLEATRLEARGRGQESQGVNELLCATRWRHQRDGEADHAPGKSSRRTKRRLAAAAALCVCAASSCR